MIKDFVDAWEKNKWKLKEYFTNTRQEEYDSYEAIVEQIFKIVINPYIDNELCGTPFNIDDINVLDDGDYQGTQIFILHKDTYQPSIEDYVYVGNYYGSCSGCDTLLAINNYGDDIPTLAQVKDYMTLALHLIQKFKSFLDTDYEELSEFEDLLTNGEADYLTNLFEPFYANIEYVVKHKNASGSEYVGFMDNKSFHTLPEFENGKHYKGMELGKHYTLKELGIEYDRISED